MNSYEREYFISRIRSGFYIIDDGPVKIKFITPTIEQEYESNEVYMQSYNDCLSQEILTEEEMLEWMLSQELWSDKKEAQIETAKKDIDRLKVEVFENQSKEKQRELARKYLRRAEEALKKLRAEKEEYFLNTCEGIASNDKALSIFEQCCYVNGEVYDFPNDNSFSLYFTWMTKVLKETQIRELARTDPWRSFWALKDNMKLFANHDRELTIDQKNILIWSQMYDNIQESMSCPSSSVIDDDDMLDGWMIVQKRKNEAERAKSELESRVSNSKISNSDEVFIVTDNKEDAEKINNMNSVGAQMIKKERMALVKHKGEAKDLDFRDQKMKYQNMQNQQFKGSFGRR